MTTYVLLSRHYTFDENTDLEDYFDGVFDSVSDANAFIKRNWDTYAKPFSPNDFVGHRVSHRDGVDFTYTLIEVKK